MYRHLSSYVIFTLYMSEGTTHSASRHASRCVVCIVNSRYLLNNCVPKNDPGADTIAACYIRVSSDSEETY